MNRTEDPSSAAAPAARPTLVFGLGREEYAIDIGLVQELRGHDNVTRLANAPDYVKGFINLRGVIVPLLDLRIKFGLAAPACDATTVVVILDLGLRTVGVVVDRVTEVVDLMPNQLRPAPAIGGGIDTGHVLAIATLDERMLILVDIGRLLGGFLDAAPERLAA
ncbi:chemotaxis protein CheW [Rugamonas sp.]|uniref:chemotaxis protein CheW n=1 Tax=Rugamonas sp. TaxID=1926287 RepID=UPI0025CCB6BF|nr:chemotaxis protein CheW [Rugamonas sp.]